MPKFLYTVIIVNLLSWFLWVQHLVYRKPDSSSSILIFLLELFISLSMTFSLVLYFSFHKKAPTFTNLRYLYRKAIKLSVFFCGAFVFYLGMRAFEVAGIINTALFIALVALIYSQAKKHLR